MNLTSRQREGLFYLNTDWGHLYVSDKDMAESGAKWTKRGKAANKEARLLMDFAGYVAMDEFVGEL